MNLSERRTLRLRLRDLAASSAFTAVALSGLLPAPILALFGVALVTSLLGWRPFATQRAWAVVVLLGAAVVLFGLAFRGALDLVIAAVSFATLVTAHRMLSEPTPGTDQQVLLASLLLMAGAAALAGDVWYALCLLAFGVFSCLTLGLAVIEGPVEREHELPLGPVLRQVSLGVAVALAGGVAFFVLFPRLSWNLASRRAGPGLLGGTTGMTDRVRLGGGGDIKTSARVVAKVRLEPSPKADRLERYWVGRRFGAFDGREWRGQGTARPPYPRLFFATGANGVMQRIELLPAYDSKTVLALEHGVIFGPASTLGPSGQAPVALVHVPGEEVRFSDDAPAYTYTVTSRADWPLLEEDEAALAPLTALPARLDPRVAALAAQLTEGVTDPEEIAQRLERWLQRTLDYTLELPGEVDDPLADFLFERKQGHCEHFATALAVMLRTRGVPARVVGGFFGGERLGERFVLRAGDAHAWVEAYVPGRGWVTLDATPDAGRGGQPQAVLARLVDAYERLEELWRARVVDYSIIDQWNFVRDLVRPPQGAERGGGGDPLARVAPSRTPTRALFFAALAGLCVYLAFRWLTQERRRPHPASALLLRLERLLDAAQVARRPGEDVEALTARLLADGHALGPEVARVARRYLEARFGGRPLEPGESDALLAPLAAAAHRHPHARAG